LDLTPRLEQYPSSPRSVAYLRERHRWSTHRDPDGIHRPNLQRRGRQANVLRTHANCLPNVDRFDWRGCFSARVWLSANHRAIQALEAKSGPDPRVWPQGCETYQPHSLNHSYSVSYGRHTHRETLWFVADRHPAKHQCGQDCNTFVRAENVFLARRVDSQI